MPIKVCKKCNSFVGRDGDTEKWWCPNCKALYTSYSEKYKIVIMGKSGGKKRGKTHFVNCLAKEWRKIGHTVIEMSYEDLYTIPPSYDFRDCFSYKKPISIRFIEYIHNPDFIFIEQMYYRLDRSEVKTPVIYQHREYTHFPDLVDPDILFASYPWRLHAFEFYLPWEYHNIPYIDYNFVAVDTDQFKPVEEKIIKGISYIGWTFPFWQFAEANGPWAHMVISDQEAFLQECLDKECVHYIKEGLDHDAFREMVGQCEALLVDSGYYGAFGRRLIEPMMLKTLTVVRIHNRMQEDFYEEMGLTEEMCYFIRRPEDIKNIKWTEEERKAKVEKAYEWVQQHTYKKRAEEVLEKFEDFKSGTKKHPDYMGWKKLNIVMGVSEGKLMVNDLD